MEREEESEMGQMDGWIDHVTTSVTGTDRCHTLNHELFACSSTSCDDGVDVCQHWCRGRGGGGGGIARPRTRPQSRGA